MYAINKKLEARRMEAEAASRARLAEAQQNLAVIFGESKVVDTSPSALPDIEHGDELLLGKAAVIFWRHAHHQVILAETERGEGIDCIKPGNPTNEADPRYEYDNRGEYNTIMHAVRDTNNKLLWFHVGLVFTEDAIAEKIVLVPELVLSPSLNPRSPAFSPSV